ncbi:MAG: M23 family metallopeptidase [bacterium]|nr:M23 family metallopeptidase [bacterium]
MSLSLLLVVSLALVFTLIYTLNQGPDVQDPGYIKTKAEQYISSWFSPTDEGNEGLILVKAEPYISEDKIASSWVLLTLVPRNNNLTSEIGTGGLIGIGQLEAGVWEYRLLGEPGFDAWLEQLPEDLLSSELKSEFDLVKERSAVSALISGEPRSSSLLQELILNLPWKFGQPFRITNLPGHGHHQGVAQEAIDFGTPEGTQLLAIADGTVMASKDDSNVSGCNVKYANDANYIRIKIAPKLAVLYLHTQVNSIAATQLKVGDKIKAGQPVAKSGATGFTCNYNGTGSGPHLHIILEQLCGPNNTQICGSVKLTFAEFKGSDPQYGKDYKSENKSPEQRLADAERQKREQEQKEKAAIQTALDNFYTAYRCANVVGCDETDVEDELAWLTEDVRKQLFDVLFCFFCAPKADKLEGAETPDAKTNYLSFPIPNGPTTQVRVKSAAKVTRGSEVEIHYTVTNIDLIKEAGKWKVDGWEITCGYVKNEKGEIVSTQNLAGCEWQISGGSSW